MSIDNPNDTTGGSGNQSAAELQERAGNDLKEVTTRAKEDLDSIAQRAASDAQELGQQAQEKIGEVTDKAKSFAAEQKDFAANQINGVADAISRVAGELEGSDQQSVGRYARDLANGLSKLGKQIESRDVDDLLGAAQDFGRNQPVAFLGIAALAGFAASRFALASNHRRDTQGSPAASSSGTDAYRSSQGGYQTGHNPDDLTGGR
jgi:ElaB/YqjD/DUF883 family membrane-anchored ribosome-binding protein